jgi:hypothetical protein
MFTYIDCSEKLLLQLWIIVLDTNYGVNLFN